MHRRHAIQEWHEVSQHRFDQVIFDGGIAALI
jgi:hypothetical protein